MGDVNPAFLSFERNCSCSVLGLGQRMINSAADDFLLVDNRMLDVIAEAKANSSAASGFDETVHRAGIEGVFAVHKLRVKHHVSLLRGP